LRQPLKQHKNISQSRERKAQKSEHSCLEQLSHHPGPATNAARQPNRIFPSLV